MGEKYFFKKWKNKNEIEEGAIAAVLDSVEFLQNNLTEKELVSIYLKGSFITREMNEKSDVDMIVIVDNKRTASKLKALRDKNKENFWPVDILPLSLDELANKDESNSRRTMFLADSDFYELIFGKKISSRDYPLKPFEKIFKGQVSFARKAIKLHREGNKDGCYGFSILIKNCFWIVYSELRLLDESPPRTWENLDKFIKDKKNIIHDAYYFRMNPTKDKKLREEFLKKFEVYLDYLDKKYFSDKELK